MPRLARKYIESSYCHVIIQGVNKEYIFENNKLKGIYKSLLKKNLENEKDIKIVAYCIMDNHAHLLLYFNNTNTLTKLMHKTNTNYAQIYNKIKKRVGYVFRDRYYTQMILSERQLFNCIAYIHNNPIKANMVKKLQDYTYSSYNDYKDKKDLITLESIQLVFGTTQKYYDMFREIHNNTNIEDIIDIKEENKDSEEIINDYINKVNKTIEEIKNNEKEFCELLLKLRHDGGLSLREMSKIFDMNKDKINRIIHNWL